MITRPKIIDVPPEWLSHQFDANGRTRRVRRAKRLTATVAQQLIEHQAQRAERRQEQED